MQLLTRSLRGIHARADVKNMTDLVRNFFNIRPTFLRDFLSSEEEDLEEEFVFFRSFAFVLGANLRK